MNWRVVCDRALRALACALVVIVGPARAEDPLCHDAQLLSGNLITDICWECMLPLRVAGLSVGGGSGDRPPGATNEVVCACENNLGVPVPGFVVSLWQPARVVETVRQSGCSPSLGGIRLPLSDRRRVGSHGGPSQADEEDAPGELAFMHVHYFSFPLLVLLEMFVEERCMGGSLPDFDLLFMTELDPTWNNSDLAFFTHAESAATANPAAVMACSTEALKMTGGTWPIEHMYWCLGAWGSLYPLSGHHKRLGGFGKTTAKLAAREIASMHRRGLEQKTFGEGALCQGTFAPMLPKSMYRISHYWPRPDANVAEKLGAPTERIGPSKNIPGVGEDAVMVVWKYNDCCVTF